MGRFRSPSFSRFRPSRALTHSPDWPLPIPSDRSNSHYTSINTDPTCPPKRGLQHREYLTSDVKVFGCRTCKTHLSIHEHIESKNFNGQHGRAYLFTTVYNINAGPPEDRPMTTGLHTVRDISCAKCGDVLGWKYGTFSLPLFLPLLAIEPKLTSLFSASSSSVDKAYDASQKYKEGKFILERTLTVDVS